MENSIPAKAEIKAAPFKNMSHNEQLELKRTVLNDTLEILTAKVEDTNYQIAEYIEERSISPSVNNESNLFKLHLVLIIIIVFQV